MALEDGGVVMGPDSSWPELEDVFTAVEHDETRRAAAHHRWLEELIDAQALRGRNGVAALTRERRAAGPDLPEPTLLSCLEIAGQLRARDHRQDHEL